MQQFSELTGLGGEEIIIETEIQKKKDSISHLATAMATYNARSDSLVYPCESIFSSNGVSLCLRMHGNPETAPKKK